MKPAHRNSPDAYSGLQHLEQHQQIPSPGAQHDDLHLFQRHSKYQEGKPENEERRVLIEPIPDLYSRDEI